MSEILVTGTVRAKQGNRYLVVTPRGEQLSIALEGLDTPKIGVDIIGVIDPTDSEARMRLVPDVTRKLLEGRARIIPSGRSDLTARMLAKILTGTGPAAIRSGTGGMIERTPTIDDPDVRWALDILEPEARRAGVALNVIDPLSLANSEWESSKLQDEVLPADTRGETSALADLRRLLNDGLTPACQRTITDIGRGLAVPSVDFVLPYSPFATGTSWCADIAMANRNEIVGITISGSDARRLSTFREIALAFAPRYLGRIKSDPACLGHLEAAFADAAAALAMLRSGSNKLAPLRFQRLREAALARWNGQGSCPPATGTTLAAAIGLGHTIQAESIDDILRLAAQIAQAHAPLTAAKLDQQRRAASPAGVYINLETAPAEVHAAMEKIYRTDLADTITRLGDNEMALQRLAKFAIYSVPFGLETAFDDLVRTGLGMEDEGIVFPADPWAEDAPALPQP